MLLASVDTGMSLTLAVALMAGVLAQLAARHLRLPGIVVLLATGVILGPQALGWVDPTTLGNLLYVLVEFGVAVILFEGGMNLEVSRLRREESSIRRLITLGALTTFVGAAAASRLLLGWDWRLAVVFGSLVVVTGPTVVTPLLRDLRLRPRVRTILEAEGVLIDPVGVIFAVVVLQFALAPGTETVARETVHVLLGLALGTAIGLAGGWLVGTAVRRPHILPAGLVNIFTFGAVILLFETSNALMPNSGIVAVTVAGVLTGNLRTPVDRDLREFKDQVTVLLIGLLFVLLAADMDLRNLAALGWRGAVVVAVLIIVVRPVGTWLSTRQARLTWQERCFMAWMAPRGIVAAALASLTALDLRRASLEGGPALLAMVFLTIAVTVILAGITARPAATWLGLRLPQRDRVAILGAGGLARALGALLQDAGRHVTFIDTDRGRCRAAHDEGFAVVRGDGLRERTWLGANMDLVGTVIGLTTNAHLNRLFVRQARAAFAVPDAYVAVDRAEGDDGSEHLPRHEVRGLFAGPVDVERWDVRLRTGQVVTRRLVYRGPSDGDQTRGDDAPRDEAGSVILSVQRGDVLHPMAFDLELAEGDAASVLFHGPQLDAALEDLVRRGWMPEA